MNRRIVDVLDRIHYARRNWNCAICFIFIHKGDGYRWVYIEGRKTAVRACIPCSDTLLEEKVVKNWAELTGRPIEEVREEFEKKEAEAR